MKPPLIRFQEAAGAFEAEIAHLFLSIFALFGEGVAAMRDGRKEAGVDYFPFACIVIMKRVEPGSSGSSIAPVPRYRGLNGNAVREALSQIRGCPCNCERRAKHGPASSDNGTASHWSDPGRPHAKL
ncbi:hypothetical protein TomMM35A_26180 [Sphingobium sp. TomMM35A]